MEIIKYIFSTQYPSLFWEIRRRIRKADYFKYWTKLRRKQENCCPTCGVVNDNSPYWKRKVTFEKR